jgi:hypothetical protein
MAKVKKMTLQEAINIFYSGVSTHSKHTMQDWFTARDIVREHPGDVKGFVKQGPIMKG